MVWVMHAVEALELILQFPSNLKKFEIKNGTWLRSKMEIHWIHCATEVAVSASTLHMQGVSPKQRPTELTIPVQVVTHWARESPPGLAREQEDVVTSGAQETSTLTVLVTQGGVAGAVEMLHWPRRARNRPGMSRKEERLT